MSSETVYVLMREDDEMMIYPFLVFQNQVEAQNLCDGLNQVEPERNHYVVDNVVLMRRSTPGEE